MTVGLTRRLADHAAASSYDALPEAVRTEAVRAFLNWVGAAIGGAGEAAPTLAARFVAARGAAPQATVIGHGLRTDVTDAAFVNCVASSVLAYDDAHLPTVAHPSGPAAAALFALAQWRGADGPAFLNALALGIELQCRVAAMLALPPAPMNRDFYVNGFSGPVGVAAAAARLLGLDARTTGWAIGLAASQAAGFRASHGTMNAHFRPGKASAVGVSSALLSAEGFDCIDDALEAPGGFIDVYAPGSDPAVALDALGERHEMLENRYKPYPCGIVVNPVIDAAAAVRGLMPADAEAAGVELFVNPLVVALTGKRAPRTTLEAHISVYHWAAVALLGRPLGLAAPERASREDPAVVTLRDRIVATPVEGMDKGEARVRVTLADGRRFEAHVTEARGSRTRPLSDAELDAKFLDLAAARLTTGGAARLLAACRDVARTDDVGAAIGPLLP